MIEIDGSLGDGGGQILRTALSLSLITGRPFAMVNIRANRSPAGLRAQHRQCVLAAAQISAAVVEGADVGSPSIRFTPGPVRAGTYRFAIGTAGSTALLLHALYLPLCLAHGASHLTLTGGTHVAHAPCYHYLERQWAPRLGGIGLRLDLELAGAGYFPRGGGRIDVEIAGGDAVEPLELTERGAPLRCDIVSGVTNLPFYIAERQAARAAERVKPLGLRPRIRELRVDGVDKGSFVVIHGVYEAGSACYDALGAPGKPVEKVGRAAGAAFAAFHCGEGAVDEYLGDQLMLPLALAAGESHYRVPVITPHMRTNAAIIARFLPAPIEFDDARKTITIRPCRSV